MNLSNFCKNIIFKIWNNYFLQGASAAGKSAQMGLSQLGGVFIVLSGGMIMSCFIAVIEFMWENRKVSSQGVRININIIQEISQFLVLELSTSSMMYLLWTL